MSPSQSEVVHRLNQVLTDRFEIPADQLKPDARLKEDLHLDSLDFVDMFVMMEKELGGSVNNVDLFKIQTLGDVYQLVADAVKAKSSSNTISQ